MTPTQVRIRELEKENRQLKAELENYRKEEELREHESKEKLSSAKENIRKSQELYKTYTEAMPQMAFIADPVLSP